MINKLNSFLNIRAGEGKIASLLMGIMLLSAAGFSLGGTGIEALYFARYGTNSLPYLYMGLGLLSLLTSLGVTALFARIGRERMYVFVPLVTTGLLILAWGLLFSKLKFIFPALWLGKESINTIVSMIAWNTAGAVCDSRQAKRLYPLFNAARILGSVLGGLGTGVLANWVGTQSLVLIWAAFMFGVFVISRNLITNTAPVVTGKKSRVKRRSASFITEMQKGWDYVRRSELMRWISFALVLFSILYFSIALPFSKSATLQYPNEEQLAGFLGLFNGLSTAAAFLVSVFLANRLYARFGIMNMILVLPLIYLLGFSSLAIYNVFVVVVIFRFVQLLWLSGVADAAYQTMFCAVPPEKRDQVNAFSNGVPEQAGVFLAGGILIIGEQAFTSQQLYIIGLVSAAITAFIIWRASFAYRRALVSSLREGRPTIFSERATLHDSISLAVVQENIRHADPIVRRVSVDMLSEMNAPALLIPALQDADSGIRVAALKGLGRYSVALPEVRALLADPEPEVRQQAIRTLRDSTLNPKELKILLEPLLQDTNPHVQLEAALGLLKLEENREARQYLYDKARHGMHDERIHALTLASELKDDESFDLITSGVKDSDLHIRRATASALGYYGQRGIALLVDILADEDLSVRDAAAQSLARIGEPSIPDVISALNDSLRTDGAIQTLSLLAIQKYVPTLREFSTNKIASALHDHELATKLPASNEKLNLLIDSLRFRAQHSGFQALRTLSLIHDRESIEVAIENLQSNQITQRAYALETLETVGDSQLVKPLLHIWESHEEKVQNNSDAKELIVQLLSDGDVWIRACAIFAAQPLGLISESIHSDSNPLIREIILQGESMDTRTTLPIMERILFLRRVSLLADLSPSDLQQVAVLTTEHHADAGEVIFEQGDAGEEMYVIVHGEVKVMINLPDQTEKEFVRRQAGEVVGEMSIISGEPRTAGLIAAEESHFLCLDKKSFEGLLRERPEVSLAIMRVLCMRLKEATK